MVGIRRSMTTTCGSSCRVSWTASPPSRACPTTSKPSSASISATRVRTCSVSSATSTRTPCPAPLSTTGHLPPRATTYPPPMASHAPARKVAPRPRRAAPVPTRARRRRRSRAGTVARVLLVGIVACVVGATTFVTGLLAAPIDLAVPPPPKSALLMASDGRTQFATIPPPQRRTVVPPEDIPQVMRHAIIAAEDERFLEHKGVDPLATVRAAYRDLTGGHTQGGSTLTQQYVKNVYVGNDRTAMRKIKEAALAVRLENRLSKDEILTDYLNVLYLGNNVSGVQAAARYYFGVDVKDLDKGPGGKRDPILELARASLLAGIAPAPSAWNPVKDFSTAKARQRYTLNQMISLHFITSAQASAAFGRSIKPVKEALPELPTDA